MFPLKDDIPNRRFPVVTIVLLAANVLVYLFVQGGWWDSTAFNAAIERFGAVPYDLINPGARDVSDSVGPLTAITSMFLHGGVLHLAGNLLFLWVFGTNVEDAMGRARFVIFYLLGGLAALVVAVVADPSSTTPTIGASGAIAGVLGAYALLYPRARVVTLIFIVVFFTVITIPAVVMLGAWFVLQAAYAFADAAQPTGGDGGEVAYFAHVGGFLFGMLSVKLFATRPRADYRAPARVSTSR